MKLDREIYKGEIKQLHYLIISRDGPLGAISTSLDGEKYVQ